MKNQTHFDTIRVGVIAGAAGGLAEIAFVTLYAAATGGDAALLARSVTIAAGASALFPSVPVALGVSVHMALAVVLGIALAFAWRALVSLRPRASAGTGPYPFMLVALVGVWAINFFVVLPMVSPAFIHLLPYSISLISKLSFGLTAATAFRWQLGATSRRRKSSFMASAS